MKVQVPNLSPDQAETVAQLIGYLNGRPRAELVLMLYDPDQGRQMVCVGSTQAPGLLFAAGLTFLRRAHAGVLDDPGAVYAAPMTEALQTALPFLEAAGIAEPAASRTVRQ